MKPKTKLEKLKTEISKLKEEFKKESARLFSEACSDFFKENPIITSFSWRAYTMYFCDGEPLEFCVYGDKDSISINGVDHYNREEENIPEECYEKASEIIRSIDEDILKDMFGDHVEITVTPEGVSIEDYSDHN